MSAFDLLRSLRLPMGDYAVFGSGPLIVRGIIELGNDLDVITRGAAWERARECGETTRLEDGTEIVSCWDGLVTMGRSWGIGDFDVGALIDDAEMIDGLPFVRLDAVIAYKRIAARPKDKEHLRLLEEYLAGP